MGRERALNVQKWKTLVQSVLKPLFCNFKYARSVVVVMVSCACFIDLNWFIGSAKQVVGTRQTQQWARCFCGKDKECCCWGNRGELLLFWGKWSFLYCQTFRRFGFSFFSQLLSGLHLTSSRSCLITQTKDLSWAPFRTKLASRSTRVVQFTRLENSTRSTHTSRLAHSTHISRSARLTL